MTRRLTYQPHSGNFTHDSIVLHAGVCPNHCQPLHAHARLLVCVSHVLIAATVSPVCVPLQSVEMASTREEFDAAIDSHARSMPKYGHVKFITDTLARMDEVGVRCVCARRTPSSDPISYTAISVHTHSFLQVDLKWLVGLRLWEQSSTKERCCWLIQREHSPCSTHCHISQRLLMSCNTPPHRPSPLH